MRESGRPRPHLMERTPLLFLARLAGRKDMATMHHDDVPSKPHFKWVRGNLPYLIGAIIGWAIAQIVGPFLF